MSSDMIFGRRPVLGMIGGAIGSCLAPAAIRAQVAKGSALTPWSPGSLDIHHISTGRGNCALFIFPDGTSAMVDAGELHGEPQFLIDPKPDGSKRSGEWMGRYAKRHLAAAGRDRIDYFLLTHLHEDHMGWLFPGSPAGPGNAYRLTGVSDVNAIIPIARFMDRDFPTYAYPGPQTRESVLNYIAFLKYQQTLGKRVERFVPGKSSQIALLRSPRTFEGFRVQNLAANGEVWTGSGTETRKRFPDLATLKPEDYPDENMCSAAIRLSYGKFDYYTGGDLTCADRYGAAPWRDIETPVAEAAGPVEIAVINHHGYYDSTGPGFVRALRPHAFIVEAWDSAHPVVNTLQNMESKVLYPNDREIYATAMKHENLIANKDVRKMRSSDGHVIVRVAPGGGSYHILVTSNQDESDKIIDVQGPFTCT